MSRKQTIFNSVWFVLLMLFVFFPFGAFLLWKNKMFTTSTRIVISGVFAVVFIVSWTDFSRNYDENSGIHIFSDAYREYKENKIKSKVAESIKREEERINDIINNHPEITKPNPYLDENVYNTIVNSRVGSFINFGSYEQDGNIENGPESIEWLIVDKDDFACLLLCKDIIELYDNKSLARKNMFNSNEEECISFTSDIQYLQLKHYFPQPLSYVDGNDALVTKPTYALRDYDVQGFAIALTYETESGYNNHYYCMLNGRYEITGTKKSKSHYLKLKEGKMGYRPIIALNLRDIAYNKKDIRRKFYID